MILNRSKVKGVRASRCLQQKKLQFIRVPGSFSKIFLGYS